MTEADLREAVSLVAAYYAKANGMWRHSFYDRMEMMGRLEQLDVQLDTPLQAPLPPTNLPPAA